MAEPLTTPERAARRQMYMDKELARAQADGESRGRSIKCGGGGGLNDWPKRHAGEPDGCTNNGSTCLCACHDPKGPADA